MITSDPSPLTLSGFSRIDIPRPPSLFPCPHIPLPFSYDVRRLDFAGFVRCSQDAVKQDSVVVTRRCARAKKGVGRSHMNRHIPAAKQGNVVFQLDRLMIAQFHSRVDLGTMRWCDFDGFNCSVGACLVPGACRRHAVIQRRQRGGAGPLVGRFHGSVLHRGCIRGYGQRQGADPQDGRWQSNRGTVRPIEQ